jgi:DNA-binding PadR family transcriptional regulator
MDVKISSDLIRGHTDTIILQLLSRKDSYGYEVYKTIMEKTGELFELKEATLYASFKRLEQDKCIISYWGDETQGGRRKYYRITEEGKELLEQSKKNWQFTVKIISGLLEEDEK